MDTASKQQPEQAEREAAVDDARSKLYDPRDQTADELAAYQRYEAAARAAGRAEADERIAGLERDLETAQHNTTRHNQDLAAVPFQVAWQRDQQQARIEELEGLLRELVEALRERVAPGREWPTAVAHAFVDAQLLLGYGDVTIGLPSEGAERA